jgi:hypothetical protein
MKALMKRWLRWDERSDYEKSVALYRARYGVARALSPIGVGLPRLMRWANTDKHQPDRAGGHRYGPAYESALRHLRWQRVRVLEIGIGGTEQEVGGRSLLAWLAYFPRGRVLGCDLQDRSALARGRLQIRQIDQGDDASLRRLAAEGPFDVIVDDGSHLSAHQLMTFRVLFDALAEGGLYVIEDVQTSYWHRPVGGVAWDGARPREADFGTTCMGWFLTLAAHLNHAEFLDAGDADEAMLNYAGWIRQITFEHNLILVTKGSNDAISNTVRRAA